MSGEALRGDMYVRLHLSAALSEQEKKIAQPVISRAGQICVQGTRRLPTRINALPIF